MRKDIKNLPASIHQKLKNSAERNGKPFQEVFYSYANERFLYRLSASRYSSDFVLKGGLMFIGWGIPLRRATRDIDVQGSLDVSTDELVNIVMDICVQDVDPDGMWFDPDTVRGENIMNGAEHQGVRINFFGYLGKASIHLQLDVSFANVITPVEIEAKYPTILDMPDFLIRGYPIETSIAEKFESMVKLGDINDRLKDFFDIWLLSQQVEINGATLANAINNTFKNRKTPIPKELPSALTAEFARNRQKDWEIFLKRSGLRISEYPSFQEVISVIHVFLWPIVVALSDGKTFKGRWTTGGLWNTSSKI